MRTAAQIEHNRSKRKLSPDEVARVHKWNKDRKLIRKLIPPAKNFAQDLGISTSALRQLLRGVTYKSSNRSNA